jgi:hypothetical protein
MTFTKEQLREIQLLFKRALRVTLEDPFWSTLNEKRKLKLLVFNFMHAVNRLPRKVSLWKKLKTFIQEHVICFR